MQNLNVLGRCAIVALTFISVGGCGSGTAPVYRGGVEAIARDQKIDVMNRTERPVFTFVVGRDLAALINWAPCVDAVRCPPIPPGSIRSEAYPQVRSGVAEREAIVYWWHAIRGADGTLHADKIRGRLVTL